MINEKCILFRKDSNKYEDWVRKVSEWDKKVEYLLSKSAEIIGLKDEDIKNKLWVSNNGLLLISNRVAEEYGFSNKVIVWGSDDMAIRDNGVYLGQWCTLKKNNKIFKEIENIRNEIKIDHAPEIRSHFFNVVFKCRTITLEEYGIFFIVDKSYLEDIKLENCEEWKLSEFYRLLESLDVK